MAEQIIIDISELYKETGTAKLACLPTYIITAQNLAGSGNIVTLTGQGPIWLYLKIAHALHGKVVKLLYNSPVTDDVVIYDHSPY